MLLTIEVLPKVDSGPLATVLSLHPLGDQAQRFKTLVPTSRAPHLVLGVDTGEPGAGRERRVTGLVWAGLAPVAPFRPLYPGSAQRGCCGEPSPGASRTCKYVSSLGFPLSSHISLCEAYFLFSFWLHCMACGILVFQSGMEPLPPAMEAQNLNPWTVRGVPRCYFLPAFITRSMSFQRQAPSGP